MKPRGVVLVAVLLVTALVAVVAATLMFRMRAELATSTAKIRGEQAYNAALSGLSRTMSVVRTSAADQKIWFDNPDLFQNQLVADDGANRWYFSVYGDDATEQATTVRYGVTDEAGKINLNVAPPEVLLNLKSMTTELVDSLVDYRDTNSEARQEGAEQDYYDQLPNPYVIPNSALSTFDELLMIKGFSAPIVYGEDANLNGILDANEDDGDTSFPPDNRDGRLDKGLRAVATVYSSEPNTDSQGKARVNINADGAPPSGAGLPAKALDFIRMARADGYTFKHPSELLEMKYTLKQAPKDAPANVKAGSVIESEVGAEELPLVMDRLTTQPPDNKKPILGLVNVNTAPAEVLATLPGLDPSVAQQIVDARRNLDAETLATVAWLYTQNIVDADAFKAVAPMLTARSGQFSVRCVGFGVPCGRFRMLEAVIDVSGRTPRLVYVRDISRLGLPFALDTSAMERIR